MGKKKGREKEMGFKGKKNILVKNIFFMIFYFFIFFTVLYSLSIFLFLLIEVINGD